jgi:hypothetical protein
MRTSTGIAVTDRISDTYGSPFIQIYLFIRTYMSALVDIKQEYKKCHKKIGGAGIILPARLPATPGYFATYPINPARNYQSTDQ